MFSTSAYRTGNDSPYVRSVLNLGLCRSIIEYVQESGRAGRDGQFACCITLYWKKALEYHELNLNLDVSDILRDMGIGINVSLGKSTVKDEMDLCELQSYAEGQDSCLFQTLFRKIDYEAPISCVFSKNSAQYDVFVCFAPDNAKKIDDWRHINSEGSSRWAE